MMKNIISQCSPLSFLLILLANTSSVKAFDLNCSTESAILWINTPLTDAYVEMSIHLDDLCKKKLSDEGNGVLGNGVCSISNSSNATSIHWKVTVNATSLPDEDSKAVKEACEQAGGRFIAPTYEIGYGPDFNYTEFFMDNDNVPPQTIDSSIEQYLDLLYVRSPDCVGKETCINETDITEYLITDNYYGVEIYNFTLYGIE